MRQRPEGTLRAKAKLSSRRRRRSEPIGSAPLCRYMRSGIPLGQRREPPQRAASLHLRLAVRPRGIFTSAILHGDAGSPNLALNPQGNPKGLASHRAHQDIYGLVLSVDLYCPKSKGINRNAIVRSPGLNFSSIAAEN